MMFTSKERQRQRTGKHGTSRDDYLQVIVNGLLLLLLLLPGGDQTNFNLPLLFLFKPLQELVTEFQNAGEEGKVSWILILKHMCLVRIYD